MAYLFNIRMDFLLHVSASDLRHHQTQPKLLKLIFPIWIYIVQPVSVVVGVSLFVE
jgi:hypothetical protein